MGDSASASIDGDKRKANSMSATPSMPGSNLANIQGNIFGGFLKDYQAFLFLEFPDRPAAGAWLKQVANEVATSAEVMQFKQLFNEMRLRRRRELLKVTWMNIAFTAAGLRALGIPDTDMNGFDPSFVKGMKQQASAIGDVGSSGPDQWIEPFKSGTIHAVMLLAADTDQDLEQEVGTQIERHTIGGVRLLHSERGKARQDQPGHEHFGYKDGVSQPTVIGIDELASGMNAASPDQFILTPLPAPPSPPILPPWAKDGSYLVFRRLRQDVASFQTFITQQSTALGMCPDLLIAKLVGRYKSGAPLERTHGQPQTVDPAAADPSLQDSNVLRDANINDFDYASDPQGALVPGGAHIRKTNPRDGSVPRLLRRGITYGEPYEDGAAAGTSQAAEADRGLLFLCYQSSIERQFEFVQQAWANNSSFPLSGAGPDPIISQQSSGQPFGLPGHSPEQVTLANWVRTLGGDYFLQPSLDGLNHLAVVAADGTV